MKPMCRRVFATVAPGDTSSADACDACLMNSEMTTAMKECVMHSPTDAKKMMATRLRVPVLKMQCGPVSSESGSSVSPPHIDNANPMIRTACIETLSSCVCSTLSCIMSIDIRLTRFSCATVAAFTLAHIAH